MLYWNGHRVMGVLAMSRAIGDHCLRPYVIPEPEVRPLCDFGVSTRWWWWWWHRHSFVRRCPHVFAVCLCWSGAAVGLNPGWSG